MGLQIPDLDDKTFEKLVEEARSLISRYAPQWTDHNLHDPGITFIDLFAWLAEMQIYHLNRVTDTHYEKFLQLVGAPPLDAQPADVNITFENASEEKVIDAGKQMTTTIGLERIVFEAKEAVTLLPLTLKSVITMVDSESQIIDNTTANEKEDMYFPPFGDSAPVGAELLLGFDRPLEGKEIHLFIDLFEGDLPPVGEGRPGHEPPPVSVSVQLAWEYLAADEWKPLDINKDDTWALNKSGSLLFTAPLEMDKGDNLYWIRCRLKAGKYEIIPVINRILLNTVPAFQVETVKNEILGEGDGFPGQIAILKKSPAIRGSLEVQVQGENSEWEKWEMKEDFESSGPDDPHYIFNPEKGEIIFGNGMNGRIPQKWRLIRVSYKTTLGTRGNIPKLQNFEVKGYEGDSVKNLAKASGGKDAETVEKAKAQARKDFKIPYRAVTSDDFEQLALDAPGIRVARAKSIPNYIPGSPNNPVYGAVTVVIVPFSRKGTDTPKPGKGFLRTLCNHLDKFRLITTDLYIIGPEYVKISVTCKIRKKKISSSIEVKNRVNKALEEFLSPLQGGPDREGWPFGRSVYPSEIYQVIDKVEGVDYASCVSIHADGNVTIEKGVVKIDPEALIFSGEHQLEII